MIAVTNTSASTQPIETVTSASPPDAPPQQMDTGDVFGVYILFAVICGFIWAFYSFAAIGMNDRDMFRLMPMFTLLWPIGMFGLLISAFIELVKFVVRLARSRA